MQIVMRETELNEAISAWAAARGMSGAVHAEWTFETGAAGGSTTLRKIVLSSGQDLPRNTAENAGG